jgi:hypothetical protein
MGNESCKSKDRQPNWQKKKDDLENIAQKKIEQREPH